MPVCKQLLALAVASVCFGATAQTPTAAPRATASAIDARYQQERAACTNGTTHKDKATCLREAVAARDAARRGQLTSSPDLEANATARCAALPESDRADCRSRVLNESNTTVKGSVEGGGIVKETTTRYVMTPEGEKQIK